MRVAAAQFQRAENELDDGVRRVGELMALPRGPLVQRFGAAPLLRLDQALGAVEEPVSPRRPALVLRTRMSFPEPIATPDDIARATAEQELEQQQFEQQ